MTDLLELPPNIEGIDTSTEIGGMLGRLALRMQAYDRLRRDELAVSYELKLYEKILPDLDPSLDSSAYTKDVAFAALDFVIVNKNLGIIRGALADLHRQIDPTDPYLLRGRKATVKMIDAERRFSATWGKESRGKIEEINFDHTDGGWFELKNRWGNSINSIGGLIFRDENGIYRPGYEINLD